MYTVVTYIYLGLIFSAPSDISMFIHIITLYMFLFNHMYMYF